MITEKDIGRRVLVNGIQHGQEFLNTPAIIISVDEAPPPIGIECDEKINSHHSCQGKGKKGHCWYVYENMITFADEFKPEYFSGLPQDVERAQKYIGRTMEFSNKGKKWSKGLFKSICKPHEQYPYQIYCRESYGYYAYCRTCPETFQEQKQYIEFKAGKLPAPERVKPKNGTIYFHLSPFDNKGFKATEWTNYEMDNNAFKNGIWLKEADIQQVAEWWRKTFGQVEAVG